MTLFSDGRTTMNAIPFLDVRDGSVAHATARSRCRRGAAQGLSWRGKPVGRVCLPPIDRIA
ncbi:MAG: hypothetical protein U1E25_01005 [Methylocystis sp.]